MSRPDPQHQPRRRAPSSAGLHAALAVAVLLAQALGLLHRTAHGPQLAHAHPVVTAAAAHGHAHAYAHAAPARADPVPSVDSHAAHAVHADDTPAASGPFGHAAGQGDACRLFDQLALADLLADSSPALAVFDAPCRAIEATGTAGARAVVTAYRARAPPALG